MSRLRSIKRIFNQAVSDYNIAGGVDDYHFSDVSGSTKPNYNTKITITGKSSSIYKGSKTIHYNRIDLNEVEKDVVMSIYATRVYDAIPTINECTNLDISKFDVWDDPVPPLTHSSVFDGELRIGTLRAKPNSFFYIGQTDISYAYPAVDPDESEVVVIGLETYCGIKESARAYREDGSPNEYFYYLGNMTSYSEVVVDQVYNAHGGFTYMTGYFSLSYSLFDHAYENVTGTTLVMDHYGMIMDIIDDTLYSERMLKSMVYNTGFVYFIDDAKAIRRLQPGLTIDQDFLIESTAGFDYIEVGTDLEIYGATAIRKSVNIDEDIVYRSESDRILDVDNQSANYEIGAVSGSAPVFYLTVYKYEYGATEPIWERSLYSSKGFKMESNPLLSIDGEAYVRTINLDSSDNRCLFGCTEDPLAGPVAVFTKINREGNKSLDYNYHLKGVSNTKHRSATDSVEWSFVSGNGLHLYTDLINPITGFISPVISRFHSNGLDISSIPLGTDIPPLERARFYNSNTNIFIICGFNSETQEEDIYIVNKKSLRSVHINPECSGSYHVFVQRIGDI